jgi:hypothetical protein
MEVFLSDVRYSPPIALFAATTSKCAQPLMRSRVTLGMIIDIPCDSAAYMGLTRFSYNHVMGLYRTCYTSVAYLGCLQPELLSKNVFYLTYGVGYELWSPYQSFTRNTIITLYIPRRAA